MKDGRYIDANGIRTHYFEAGAGAPIVLFNGGNFGHGLCADCAYDWGPAFDALARRAHVYAIDKIGQGYSDNPETEANYTMVRVVRHAYDAITALGLAGVHLVGHSRGGYLVCRLALEHPGLVRSCTIIDSNTTAPGEGRNHIVFADAPRPLLTAASQRWILERYSYNPLHVTDDWVDYLTAVAGQPKYKRAWDFMVARNGFNTQFLPEHSRQKAETHRWLARRGMPCPTLLVWGFNDPTATIDQGLALLEILNLRQTRTEFAIFNEAGHFAFREHPEAFAALVAGFAATA